MSTTINEVIEKVDKVKPNTYDENTKAEWIYELDGRVSSDIMLQNPPQKYEYPEDGDRELLVPFPYDEMYKHHVMARIHYQNKEYGDYNNALMMFTSIYDDYAKWYIRNNRPEKVGGFTNMY